MAVEVTAPAEYLGSVMGDVSSRRGMIEGQEEEEIFVTVQASIPYQKCSVMQLICDHLHKVVVTTL